MKKIIFLLFLPAFFLLGTMFQTHAQSDQQITRAYIKIKSPKGLSLVNKLLRHNFGDNIFSIEAPKIVIENLKSNSNIEFRGYATQWQLVDFPTLSLPFMNSSLVEG